jgi:hypothetical protein
MIANGVYDSYVMNAFVLRAYKIVPILRYYDYRCKEYESEATDGHDNKKDFGFSGYHCSQGQLSLCCF